MIRGELDQFDPTRTAKVPLVAVRFDRPRRSSYHT